MSTYGQKTENDSLINSIKKDVTSFFVQKGVLKEEIIKDNLNYVFIVEIKDEKVVGYNTNGIYIIGVYQSHSAKHILIKEKNSYKIFDLNQIDIALKETIDYSIRNNIDKSEMLFYLKNIMQKYDDNTNHNYTSIQKK
jgi:hypothetical protein